jgi:cell division septum initiation protein DivIVA
VLLSEPVLTKAGPYSTRPREGVTSWTRARQNATRGARKEAEEIRTSAAHEADEVLARARATAGEILARAHNKATEIISTAPEDPFHHRASQPSLG